MMIEHTIQIRPRYGETDQMGIVYYGRYAEYFEVARTEWLRSLGMSYAWMEQTLNILLPVRHLSIHYKAPAYYDQPLSVITVVKEKPVRLISFHHTVLNEDKRILATGQVELVFVDKHTWKPVKAPSAFLQLIEENW